jgi:hypothetical protein
MVGFFACAIGQELHVWKDSPTGYILHQKLAVTGESPRPFLSPNGESIIITAGSTIHLLPTKDPILSLSSVPTPSVDGHNFILAFSPDEKL